jgi:hypothetical protein
MDAWRVLSRMIADLGVRAAACLGLYARAPSSAMTRA